MHAIPYGLKMHAVQYGLQTHAIKYGLQLCAGLQLCNFIVHKALAVHHFTLNSLANIHCFLIYALSVLVERPLASYALFC
jgi:hypothetical protein